MPRYVVLRHEPSPGKKFSAHFDLMLERDGALWTWALPELPVAGQAVWGRRLDDHRLAYLDYEGPISGDRGAVRRIAAGEYVLRNAAPDRLEAELRGAGFSGILALEREVESPYRWRVALSPTCTVEAPVLPEKTISPSRNSS